MNEDERLSIERVFSLGEFKSLHVKVNESDADTEELENIAIRELCTAYMTYFMNYIIVCKLEGDEKRAEYWSTKLEELEKIRKDLQSKEE